MAIIEVDIWSAGKANKLGTGPIIAVADFRASERPNEAGRWSFTVPGEADTSAIVLGREAYGYVWERGDRLCIFGGEIIDMAPVQNGRGGVNLEVGGLGLLDHFNYVWLDDLEVKDFATTRPTQVFELSSGNDLPNTYDDDTGTNSSITIGAVGARSYYICYPQPFWNVQFTFSTPNAATTSTLSAQYYAPDDGTTSPPTAAVAGWKTLTITTDGTAVSGRTFGQNGTVEFAAPSDWIEGLTGVDNAVQGYWVRFYVSSQFTVSISEIEMMSYGVDTLDFTTIMTAASSLGFSIDTTNGYSATTNGSYFHVRNSTALAALRQMAETENGIFRINGHDTYSVTYLRDSGYATNLYAVGPAAPQDWGDIPSNQMLITGIDPQTTTDDEANRIYPRGAGNGSAAQIDLSLADTSILPSGYSATSSYVQKDSVTVRKSAGKNFPQIRTIDGARNSREAATQLLRMALAELQARVDPIEYVRVELIHLPRALQVGDIINISYRAWGGIGRRVMVDIDGAYTITQISYNMVNGVLVASATCSNVTRTPRNQFDYVLGLAESAKRTAETAQGTRAEDIFGQPITRIA